MRDTLAAIRLASALMLAAALPLSGQERGSADGERPRTRGEQIADSLDAPAPAVEPELLGRDTVIASPGRTYDAGGLRRFLFGDLNRDLWHLEFPVPVLDLDRVGGGLELDELSGGLQTLGIRLASRDGRTFQFRSIVKTPSRALPAALRGTPANAVAEEPMAALFPLSALVVAELLESAGILVARPRLVVMPDDPRLGEYREAFAGLMGWLEERPNEGEGDTPGFAGSSKITATDELFEELAENPRSYVNARVFLKARLIDMLVGDWDRHVDQWRWASFEEGERTRWDPIPRDRDWALARVDGVFAGLVRVYSPKWVGFSADPPDPFAMSWAAQELDRRWLPELTRSEFLAVARELRGELDDQTIDRAVGALPASYRQAIGAELTRNLRLRRDALDEVAMRFYDLMAAYPNVFASDEPERVTVEAVGDGGLRLVIESESVDGLVMYDRRFEVPETREVRVYLGGGDDQVEFVGGELPMDIRIVGGEGDDRFVDRTADGSRIHVYDHEGDNTFTLGDRAYATESPFEGQDEPPDPYFIWDRRDWGHSWVPRPELRYDSDIGVYAGFGISRYGFGFGRAPWRSKYSVSVLSGFAPDEWIGDIEFERPFGDRGWRGAFNLDWATQHPTWFYGFGNETVATANEAFHRAHRNAASIWLQGVWAPDSVFSVKAGPAAELAGPIHGEGTVFDTLTAYGTTHFHQLGARARVRYDARDRRDLPTSGVVLQADGRAFPALLDVEDPYAKLRAEATTYLSAGLPGEPTLYLNVTGEHVWGRAPFGAFPFLGGSHSLPGYVQRRFLGRTAVAAGTLLRWGIASAHVGTDLRLGVHGMGTVGRVWLDGESSARWHPSFGGGAWVNLPSLGRTVSLTFMHGEGGSSALYLDMGFLF